MVIKGSVFDEEMVSILVYANVRDHSTFVLFQANITSKAIELSYLLCVYIVLFTHLFVYFRKVLLCRTVENLDHNRRFFGLSDISRYEVGMCLLVYWCSLNRSLL